MDVKNGMTFKDFRDAVRSYGLNLKEFAGLIGKTQRAISKWSETDEVKDPAVIFLLRFLSTLEGDPHHLTKSEISELLYRAIGSAPPFDLEPLPKENIIKKLEALTSQLKNPGR